MLSLCQRMSHSCHVCKANPELKVALEIGEQPTDLSSQMNHVSRLELLKNRSGLRSIPFDYNMPQAAVRTEDHHPCCQENATHYRHLQRRLPEWRYPRAPCRQSQALSFLAKLQRLLVCFLKIEEL
jgi:hypothetical protein